MTTCRSDASKDWLTAGRFAWMLGGLFALTYPGLLAGTQTLFFRDYGVIAYPTIAYQHDSFWRGEWPLWTPFSHCGAPFLAQWGVMTLYPGSLIYLLLPLPWSLSLFWAAHLFLGGIGMYRLAARWTESPFAAGVAGLVFVFNGLIFSSLAWPNYSVAIGWMPWVVLLTESAWRQRGGALARAALAGAMQMLSGVPEIVLLTWIFISLLWLREMIQQPSARGVLVLRQCLLVLWVAGLTAAQLLPFFDLIGRSQRDVNFGSSGWAMPGSGWANLLVPLFHTAKSPQGVFYQPRHVFITSYYLGLGWMTLAGFAVCCSSFPRKFILLISALAGMILALGDAGLVFPMLKTLFPQLGFARFPIKFFYITAFSLPLMAAHGVSVLTNESPETQRSRRHFGVVLGLALGAVGVIVLWSKAFSPTTDHWLDMAVNSSIRVALMMLVGACLFWAGRAADIRRRRIAQGLVLAVLWVDAVSYAPHLIPTLPSEAVAPADVPMHPPPKVGYSRAMVSSYAEQRLYSSRVPDFFNDYVGKRLALWANLNLIDRIPKVDGGLTLQIREEAEIETALRRDTTNAFPKLLDFLGVNQISAPESVVDWQERKSARGWITAGQKPVLAPWGKTLEAVLAEEFDPQREVILESEAGNSVKFLEYQPAAMTSEVHFETRRVELQVESTSATMLVIAQTYHPNWRAWVDDARVPILRANHAFQAFAIPSGKHSIRLIYQDNMFMIGSLISLASVAAALLVLLRSRTQRKAAQV